MDFAHFTVPASGEIFLGWNGLSVAVQMLTRKIRYGLDFGWLRSSLSFRMAARHIPMPVQVLLTE